MKNHMYRYTTAQREKAIRLFKNGMSTTDIAQIVGAPRQTVAGWCYRESAREDARRRSVDGRITPKFQAQVGAHLAEEERYAHFYDDPNVAILGDPPLHRSALGKKLRAEGRL